MPEVAEQLTKPRRTWRPMAAWTGAILLALGLAWFVGAVVVPMWKTREVVRETAISSRAAREPVFNWGGARTGRVDIAWWIDPDAEYRRRACRLGDQKKAVQLLSLYVSMPDKWATDKDTAIMLLGGCGANAVPALGRAIKDGDPSVRAAAAEALKKIRGEDVPK